MSRVEQKRAWSKKNPESVRLSNQKRYAKNKELYKDKARQYRLDNIPRYMLMNAKLRASKTGLDFDIELDDIIIPEVCPVLGVRLEFGTRKDKYNSPSLDRFDNARGYVKGNIRVISYRANKLKSDMTSEECKKILEYMKNV